MRAHRGVAAPASALGLAALLAILLAACASLGPRIAPPKVSVDEVRLARIDGADAWFEASVTLTNPNAREVAVDGLDAALTLEGERVATFALAAPVVLPPGGAVPARITARAGFDALLRGIAHAMRAGAPGGAPMLRYEFTGDARLAGGLMVPFRRSGQLGTRAPRT
jgi:hypothetical protein